MAKETEIDSLVVRFTGDTSDYQAAIREVDASTVKYLKSIDGTLTKLIGKFKQTTDTQAKEVKEVSEEVKKSAEEMKKASEEAKRHNDVLSRGAQVTSAMETSTERYNREVAELGDLLKESAITQETYSRAIHEAATRTDEYAGHLESLEKELKDSEAAQQKQNELMRKGEGVTRQMENATERYQREIDELDDLLKSGAISQETYNRAVKQADKIHRDAVGGMQLFGKSLGDIGGKLKSFGSSMSLYVTTPLTGLGALATREAMAFGGALSGIEALADVPAEEVAKLREEILRLAPELGRNPTELADAIGKIVGSGIKGAAALETLEAAAKASGAGLGTTDQVADAVTSAINSYGEANLSAARATDILTAAVIEGKAEANTFAPVLGQVLPIAAELGVEFDEAAGMMAFLTKSTGSASLAATGFRGILTQIIRPTSQATDAMEAAGTSIEEVRKTVAEKGLLVALRELRSRFEENGIEMSGMFADVEGLNAVLQVTGTQADMAAESIDYVTNSVGATDKAFAAASNTAGFRWSQAMVQARIAMIQLGDVLAPVMSAITSAVSKVATIFSSMSDNMKLVVVAAGGIAAAIGPVLVTLGTMAQMVNSVSIALGAYNAQLGIMAVNTQVAAAGAIALKVALVGGALVGIGLLATAVYKLNTDIQKLNDELERGAELSGELNKRYDKQTADTLKQARKMDEGDRLAFLQEEMAKAEKDLTGKSAMVSGLQKRVDDFNYSPVETAKSDEREYVNRVTANGGRILGEDDGVIRFQRRKNIIERQFGSAINETDQASLDEQKELVGLLKSRIDQIKNAIEMEEETVAARKQFEDAMKDAANIIPNVAVADAGTATETIEDGTIPVEAPIPGSKTKRRRTSAASERDKADTAFLSRIAVATEGMFALQQQGNGDPIIVEPAEL